jgi:hypothetical protein
MPQTWKTSRGKTIFNPSAECIGTHKIAGRKQAQKKPRLDFSGQGGRALPLLPLPLLPLGLVLGPLVREGAGGRREGLANRVDEGRLRDLVFHNIYKYALGFWFCKFIFKKK